MRTAIIKPHKMNNLSSTMKSNNQKSNLNKSKYYGKINKMLMNKGQKKKLLLLLTKIHKIIFNLKLIEIEKSMTATQT